MGAAAVQIALVAAAYVVVLLGFGVVSLARSWRMLAVAAVATIGGFVLTFWWGGFIYSDGGIPMGYLAALIYVSPVALFLMSVSALFGVVSRIGALALRRDDEKPRLLAGSSVVGFAVLNVTFFCIFIAFPAYFDRPLSEACLESFELEVGGQVLSVPPAPYVFTRRSPPADGSFVYSLDSNAQTREICERTTGRTSPLRTTSVSLNLGRGDQFTERWPSYCRGRSLPEWDRAICEQDRYEAPAGWPRSISFFDGQDTLGVMTSSSPPSETFERYFGDGTTAESSSIGVFRKYQQGNTAFWISDDPALALPDGQRFIAECSFQCQVVFEAPAGLHVAYDYYLQGSDERLHEAAMRSAHAKAIEIVDAIVQP